jgi:hypothetical protein
MRRDAVAAAPRNTALIHTFLLCGRPAAQQWILTACTTATDDLGMREYEQTYQQRIASR